MTQLLLFDITPYVAPVAKRIRRAARKCVDAVRGLAQAVFDFFAPKPEPAPQPESQPNTRRRYFASYELCPRCRARRVQKAGATHCKECLRVKGDYKAETDGWLNERLSRLDAYAARAMKGEVICD